MLDDRTRQWLRERFGAGVRFDEPLARHTWFGIGGPADALVDPETVEALMDVVGWAAARAIPMTVIGGGSNLLVRDGGVRGLVIRLQRLPFGPRWREQKDAIEVTAGAGLPLRGLCALALRKGWRGLNFALGIPGTVGGAVCMNAGTGLGCMADVLEAITVIDPQGKKANLAAAQIAFGYRRAELPVSVRGEAGFGAIVVEAVLNLLPGEAAVLKAEARQIMRRRAGRQPLSKPSAGCFFRNPAPDVPAGRLIEAAGLKGTIIGDAQVSERHANFIINRGRATAAEILQLKAIIEARVHSRFGIRLEPEVRIIGQEKNT